MMRQLRNTVAAIAVALSLLSGGMALASPGPFPRGEAPADQAAPFSAQGSEATHADETFRLFGEQRLEEGSIISADGRVFNYEDEILFQFPGEANLLARLSGEKEVDEDGKLSAGDPNGRGTARVELTVDPAELCVTLRVRDIALPAAAAHIHRGEAGENGPVVIPLPTPGEDGRARGCPSEGVASELLQEIADHPERFYVNVHNATYPAGAVRGQLQQDPSFFVISPGDVNVFRERLFELDDSEPDNPKPVGEQIGTVVATCTFVTVGVAPEDISAMCSRVFTLDGRGELSTSEAFTFADPLEDTLTLDGGSGEFRDAGGQIEFDVQPITPELANSIYTVQLLHLND